METAIEELAVCNESHIADWFNVLIAAICANAPWKHTTRFLSPVTHLQMFSYLAAVERMSKAQVSHIVCVTGACVLA